MAFLNILVWVLQILLAVVNAFHGWLFATWTPATEERMKQRMPKPLGLHPAFRTFIGVAELLAAVGLVLPAATGILSWLTPLAAAGFAVVMTGSAVYHLQREERSNVLSSAVLCILAVIVAYMRWQVVPV